MNKTTFRSVSLAAALGLLAAAPSEAQSSQFAQYVALGDSLTAGWESGCLVQRNQVNSYPAQLAHILFAGDFEMPLVSEGPLTATAAPKCLGAIFVPPASLSVTPMSEMGNPLNTALPRPYNNLGIPGAEVADLTTLTHGNPNGTDLEAMSALVLRNVTGSPFDGRSAVQEAGALLAPAPSSSLLTLWIGSNNTLGASTSGIVVDGVTLVSAEDFQASFEDILAGIPSGTALVVANIPDVTVIPFSSTIPPVLVNPATRQPVIPLVPLLGQGDTAYPCTPEPPNHGCPLPPGTLVNLPASALLGQGVGIPVEAGGTGLPLPHGSVDATGAHAGVTLYPDEIALLQERTGQYNQIIASAPGAVLVDANALLNGIAAHGYEIGGITLTTSFLTGGFFSYDGVHPSTIGYTAVADAFIQAINVQTSSDYARPNFSNTLFTPNPPNPGTSANLGAGPWNYSFGMWSDVLQSTSNLRALSLPAVAAGPRMIPRAPVAPRTPLARPGRPEGREPVE
jgi:lysophospholipase L1-like esterase